MGAFEASASIDEVLGWISSPKFEVSPLNLSAACRSDIWPV